VLVDGKPIPEEEALAFWDRFSTWMEEHRGDLAGFAAKEGYASVHPGVEGDKPVLRASKSAEQRPYASVTGADAPSPPGGSPARQAESRKADRQGSNPRNSAGKSKK
jgi:hypothetical protein